MASEPVGDCLFCKIVSGDVPATVVYEDDQVLGFEDLNPQAPVHVLLIPKEHVTTLNDLRDEHRELIGHMYLCLKKIADEKGVGNKGYRVVANCLASAGQSVFHVHFHLLGGRSLHLPPG